MKNWDKAAITEMHASIMLCAKHRPGVFTDYKTGILSATETEALKSHAHRCEHCKQLLDEADQELKEIEREAAAIPDEALIKVIKERLAQDAAATHSVYKWAASAEIETRSAKALGAVVDPSKTIGALFECTAWVSTHEHDRPQFDIWCLEAVTLGDGSKTQGPLSLMEEKFLDGLFRMCPALNAYNLDRRYIKVDTSERIIEKADSLALTIIMAILLAFEKPGRVPPTLYSAGLEMDGTLKPVDGLAAKIEAGIQAGIGHFVFSTQDEPEVPAHFRQGRHFHFFNHLQEVLEHFKLSGLSAQCQPKPRAAAAPPRTQHPAEPLAVQTPYPTPSATTSTGDLEAILRRIDPAAMPAADLKKQMAFFEQLCQTGGFKRNVCAAFLCGDAQRIADILPKAHFSFIESATPFALNANYHKMATLLDGRYIGAVIDAYGHITALCRTDIEPPRADAPDSLLSGIYHRYAGISRLTAAVVYFIPPYGNRLHIYYKGELVGKYANGRWQAANHGEVLAQLEKVATTRRISRKAIFKALKTALLMAEEEMGGAFAFLENPMAHADLWDSQLDNRFELTLKPLDFAALPEAEIAALAKVDGAMIIDHGGTIRACQVFFNTQIECTSGQSIRNQYCKAFSQKAGALTIVASRLGEVNVYLEGESIARF